MSNPAKLSLAVFLLLAVIPAAADPVAFHPGDCEFSAAFPASPATTQSKTETSRGDSVTTDRATLNTDGNYLRAECTHVPGMHFIDEDILNNNMRDMGASYKLDGVTTFVEHNAVAGPIGHLRGRGRVGGMEMTIEVRRFTGKASIFDLWIAAAPDGFPTQVDTDFLKSVTLDGKQLP